MAIRVAIDGIGGLGRHFFLAALESGFTDLFEIVRINEAAGQDVVLSRLALDSQYGRSPAPIAMEGDSIVVGERNVFVTTNEDLKKLNWDKDDIDIVVTVSDPRHGTGRNAQHLASGAKKVLSIGNADGADATIVPGVNEQHYGPDDHHIISTGSSSTVRAATLLAIARAVGDPKHGSMSVVQPASFNSAVLDGPVSDGRLARGGAANVVAVRPDEIDVASAKALYPIPVLQNEVAVPTSGVGWISGSFQMGRRETATNLIDQLGQAIHGDDFIGLVGLEQTAVTARDAFGNSHSLVLDSASLQQGALDYVGITAWFDAEWSLACRGVDVLALICESGVPGTA